MKKIILLILILVFLVAFSAMAYASGQVYIVEEFDFEIAIPDEWMTFTRDIDIADENLMTLKLDRDYLLDQFSQKYIYLNSIRLEPLTEIVLTVLEHEDFTEIVNFSSLSEQELNGFCKYLMGEEADEVIELFGREFNVNITQIEDTEYQGYEIYSTNGISYVILNSSQTVQDQVVYTKQYTTIVNSKLITIALKEYEGEVTRDDADILKGISDSLQFGHIDEKKVGLIDKYTAGATMETAAYSLLIAVGVAILIVVFTNRSIAKEK